MKIIMILKFTQSLRPKFLLCMIETFLKLSKISYNTLIEHSHELKAFVMI